MIKNYRLLYDIEKIQNSFKDVLLLNIYDYRTMEDYVEENSNSLNVKELQIIQETISEEKENLKMIKGFFITFITALLTVIAFGVTAIVTIISALSTISGSDSNTNTLGTVAFGMGGLVTFYIIILSVYYFKRTNDFKNIVKLQEAIRIIIAIKENKN